MAIFRKNVTNSKRRTSIEKNLRKEEEMISEFPDNPEYHLEKASNLIEMSLIEEFPIDLQDILQLIRGTPSNFKDFDYKNSFLSKAIAEFDTAINLKRGEIKYHIAKATSLEKIIFAVRMINQASMDTYGSCIISSDKEMEVIPNYVYNGIEQEILKEFDIAVELDNSEREKYVYLYLKISFLSGTKGHGAAMNEIERCIELYPKISDLHYLKVMELIDMIKKPTNELGRGANEIYKECLEECEKAITIEPSKPAYHLLKG